MAEGNLGLGKERGWGAQKTEKGKENKQTNKKCIKKYIGLKTILNFWNISDIYIKCHHCFYYIICCPHLKCKWMFSARYHARLKRIDFYPV